MRNVPLISRHISICLASCVQVEHGNSILRSEDSKPGLAARASTSSWSAEESEASEGLLASEPLDSLGANDPLELLEYDDPLESAGAVDPLDVSDALGAKDPLESLESVDAARGGRLGPNISSDSLARDDGLLAPPHVILCLEDLRGTVLDLAFFGLVFLVPHHLSEISSSPEAPPLPLSAPLPPSPPLPPSAPPLP